MADSTKRTNGRRGRGGSEPSGKSKKGRKSAGQPGGRKAKTAASGRTVSAASGRTSAGQDASFPDGGKQAAERSAVRKARRYSLPALRTMLGVMMAVLALCSFFGAFESNAILLNWLASLLKGLFGYGCWLSVPVFAFCAAVLLRHPDKPARERVLPALALMPTLGILGHITLCRQSFPEEGVWTRLWSTGQEAASGGVFSGTTARLLTKLFSWQVPLILFLALFLWLLTMALRWNVPAMVDLVRRRIVYGEDWEDWDGVEEEDESWSHPRVQVVRSDDDTQRVFIRQQFDFPLDEEDMTGRDGWRKDRSGEDSWGTGRNSEELWGTDGNGEGSWGTDGNGEGSWGTDGNGEGSWGTGRNSEDSWRTDRNGGDNRTGGGRPGWDGRFGRNGRPEREAHRAARRNPPKRGLFSAVQNALQNAVQDEAGRLFRDRRGFQTGRGGYDESDSYDTDSRGSVPEASGADRIQDSPRGSARRSENRRGADGAPKAREARQGVRGGRGGSGGKPGVSGTAVSGAGASGTAGASVAGASGTAGASGAGASGTAGAFGNASASNGGTSGIVGTSGAGGTVPEADPRKARTAASREVAAQQAAVSQEIARNMVKPERKYRYPALSNLYENKSRNYVEAGAELRGNSRRLADTLNSFGVEATPGDVIHGPAVTRYEYTLEQGVKLSKITNLADDIALALGATGVRIAPIPTKSSVVGIEVPNRQVTPVLIRDVVASQDFRNHPSTTAFALGKDIGGKNIVGCIEQLPHVLIAGTTGSGKSVCTNSLIISMLFHARPDQVRFIMVDPKMVELAPYNGIPHLLIPVVTDPKKAAGALQWATVEMMKRYRIFSEHGVKKLSEYNKAADVRGLEPMPSIVVVIDELADLMMAAAKEVEESIVRIAQMGRAAGMHLVIATQRPSADVITGLMKANIPSRIAFAVASAMESRIILDTPGAEKLVGKGDMLYAPLGESRTRVQGCYISPEEIERVVAFVKQTSEASYDNDVIAKIEAVVQEKKPPEQMAIPETPQEDDELLPAAVEVVLETGQASVSMLQRRLKLGYSRAARLVDQMEEKGYVGPFEGSRPRQLLLTQEKWQEMKLSQVPAR